MATEHSIANFTMVRSSITIASRATSSITKTFAGVCAQRRRVPYLPHGMFFFSWKVGKRKFCSTRIFTLDSWDNGTVLSFASRSMNIMKKDGAIILSPVLLYMFRRDISFSKELLYAYTTIHLSWVFFFVTIKFNK